VKKTSRWMNRSFGGMSPASVYHTGVKLLVVGGYARG